MNKNEENEELQMETATKETQERTTASVEETESDEKEDGESMEIGEEKAPEPTDKLPNQVTSHQVTCDGDVEAPSVEDPKEKLPKPSPREIFTFKCEELVQGTKVILPVEGVFFRGYISIIQEPDLFGVVLAGERGRRPHWRATDQLLTQAVKDVVPMTEDLLPVGTRVCAHWSPQYRCFYPGTVVEAPEDENEEEGKVWIEFDDGDSGIFPFCEVRLILSGKPVEDAESSTPATHVEPKRPARTTVNSNRTKTKQFCNGSRSNSCSESSGDESIKPTKSKRKTAGKGENLKNTEDPQRKYDVSVDDGKLGESVESDSESEKTSVSRKDKYQLRKGELRKKGESIIGKDTGECKFDSEQSSSAASRQSKRKSQKSSRDCGRSIENKRTLKERSKPVSSCNEPSDPVDESTSDWENLTESKGIRPKDSTKYSDLDLRKKSLNLSLTSSTRSSGFSFRNSGGESPKTERVSHDDDSESFSDTFDESPLVESKQFQPRLPRRRRSELDRLQMDLKSSGQLWQWSGRSSQNKRRGKGRKVFYRAISRADETISVGDCAVFMSSPSKSNNLPYVGKIESMWEGCSGCMMVRVKWFYHPEETKKGRRPLDGKYALYLSTHIDENDIQTISHRCEVLSQEDYKRRMQTLENANTRSSLRTDRIFCCIGKYDPATECFQTD